jgi:hypothetical protein
MKIGESDRMDEIVAHCEYNPTAYKVYTYIYMYIYIFILSIDIYIYICIHI